MAGKTGRGPLLLVSTITAGTLQTGSARMADGIAATGTETERGRRLGISALVLLHKHIMYALLETLEIKSAQGLQA